MALTVSASAGPLDANDAGTGADAPNDAASAYQLPAQGSYAGMLSPPGDADWYVLSAGEPDLACANVTIDSAAIGRASLSVDPSAPGGISFDIVPGATAILPLAAPELHGVTLGFTPGTATVSGGSYQFSITIERPRDVPTSLLDGCFTGSIDSILQPQQNYTFMGITGTSVALSMGATGGSRLALVAPSGAISQTLSSGDAGTFTLNETGTWSLVESIGANSHSTYMIGFARGAGPEPDPCRPNCAAAVG